MAIQRKPKSNDNEAAAKAFIDGDSHTPSTSSEPKARAVKKPVALRFDETLLGRIDAAAAGRGMSRNAIISYWCAEGLKND